MTVATTSVDALLDALPPLYLAIWADPGVAFKKGIETTQLVRSLSRDAQAPQMMDAVVVALLDRAERDGNSINESSLNHPFYRLQPSERVLLALAHRLHWNYSRMGRALGLTDEQLEEALWTARLHLGLSIPATPLPTGSSDPDGPEYNPRRPWTQKYLDQAYNGRERAFFEGSLRNSEKQVETLNQARIIFSVVEQSVPRFEKIAGWMGLRDQLSEILKTVPAPSLANSDSPLSYTGSEIRSARISRSLSPTLWQRLQYWGMTWPAIFLILAILLIAVRFILK